MNQDRNAIKESEISKELPTEIYQETLKEIIKNKCDATYEDCEVMFEAGSAKGDNYMGIIHRITVKPPKGDTLRLIVKLPSQNPARREEFFARPSFLREAMFYNAMYPMFEKFQLEKGIDVKKDGFSQKPECYKALTEDLNEGLFFEDLKASGYEMFDRHKEVTNEHVFRVMEALGKFHALSFAIKDQKPELIEEFKQMEDILHQRDPSALEQVCQWFEHLKKQSFNALDLFDNEDLKKQAMKELGKDFFELIGETVVGEKAEPYSVICHGDCWNNNIMYRYENGVPVEIRLLDWQIMRYASPVTDLCYYIFCCTSKELRDKHYKEFLERYHSTLTNFLRRLGSDPEKLFPRSAFDDHLRQFGKYGFTMSILVLPIITSKVEDMPDMDEMAKQFQNAKEKGEEIDEATMTFTSSKTVDVYNKRMCGVIQDMYDLKYI